MIHDARRDFIGIAVTRHPTIGWIVQQRVECSGSDGQPLRFLSMIATPLWSGTAFEPFTPYRAAPRRVRNNSDHFIPLD